MKPIFMIFLLCISGMFYLHMINIPDKLDLEVNKLYFYGLLKSNSHQLYNPYVKVQETGGERGLEFVQCRLVRLYVHVHVPEQT